jgi:AcrR family transcriptional regulator
MKTSFGMSPNSSKFAQRREHCIAVAAEVFADKGYLGASTQEIAARLGMQQASLYHYFRSKEEALEEVCLLAAQGALMQLEELLQAELPVDALMRAVVHRQLYGLRCGCHAMVVFHEQRHHLAPERLVRVREPSRRFRYLLEQALEHGVRCGQLRPNLDCALSVRALLGLCQAAAAWYARDPRIDIEHLARHHAELFLHGMCIAGMPPSPAA